MKSHARRELPSMVLSLAAIAWLALRSVECFSPMPVARRSSYSLSRRSSALSVDTLRDADYSEMLMGGERYLMVPLPDSMMDTTLFVGNLCEFVTDGDLSALFSDTSSLYSVPACVARKANMMSLQYGFVAFRNSEEKDRAILKFHNYELNGKRLRVECIRDEDTQNRVRVPEKLVVYLCGEVKNTGKGGQTNTMRRVSKKDVASKKAKQAAKKKKKKQKANKAKAPIIRLNDLEQAEMDRASRKGYVSLLSTAFRNGRKSSGLANSHREWCDAREKPQIILCKASGGRQFDNVIVDLSPLRVHGIINDHQAADEFLSAWKKPILAAATNAGMELRDDCMDGDDDSCLVDEDDETVVEKRALENEIVFGVDARDWATRPISRLPPVSIGVFEGERVKAKAMAKELAVLWELPERDASKSAGNNNSWKKNGKSKRKARPERRRRDRNPYYLNDLSC